MKKCILILVVMIGFGISANAKLYRVTYSIDVIKVYKSTTNNQEFSEGYRTEEKAFDVDAEDARDAQVKAMSACNEYCRGDQYCCVENKENPRGEKYDFKVYYRKIPSLSSVLER